jgi:hypothetical protein
MKYLKKFNEEKSTDIFVVNTKTKKIEPSSRSSYTYWHGDKKGEIDMEISISSDGQQEEYAKKVYEALKSKNLGSIVKKIFVEIK